MIKGFSATGLRRSFLVPGDLVFPTVLPTPQRKCWEYQKVSRTTSHVRPLRSPLKAVKPKDQDYALTDGNGLQLRVRVNRSIGRHRLRQTHLDHPCGENEKASSAYHPFDRTCTLAIGNAQAPARLCPSNKAPGAIHSCTGALRKTNIAMKTAPTPPTVIINPCSLT